MFNRLLSRRGLSFDRLRALVDFAETGSIAKAARGDPNRQSQYSRQIRELEQFFGVELTQRRGKGIVLTETGKRLVQLARETFHRLNDFEATNRNLPLELKLGAGDSLLQWLVLPRLGALQKRFPNTRIQLRNRRSRDIVTGLTELELDLGLIRASRVSPQHRADRVRKLTYSLFVPRRLVLARKTLGYRWVLENIPLAMQSSAGDFQRSIEQETEKRKIKLNLRLGCESFPQACRAALSGDYAAILPTLAAVDLKPDDFLQLPIPILKPHESMICLAWNPRLLRVRSGFEKVIANFREILAT